MLAYTQRIDDMFSTTVILSNDTDLKDEFLEFCKKSYESNTSQACKNMWSPTWNISPETLPYLIYNTDRFSNNNGIFFILRKDGNIIGSSGIYISDFDKNVAIGGVRSWINPEYKANLVIGRQIFPHQLKWAINKSIKSVAFTFNEYNNRLVNYFTRTGLGITKNRTPDMFFYNGVHVVDFPVLIQHTKQWVIYHKIDELYTPNWQSIRYKE